MKIDDLNLSVRTYNCLKRGGIDTVDQLQCLSDADLLKLHYLGAKSLKEVRDKIGPPKRSNGDRIRSMSDRDLAMFIKCPYEVSRDATANCYHGVSCLTCCLNWLQQAEEVK